MKKNLIIKNLINVLLISLAIVYISCTKETDDTNNTGNNDITLLKKYGIEKGIFVLKNFNTLVSTITYDTIYFKEYGAIECRYVYDEKKILKEIDMQIGDGYEYYIYPVEKKGQKYTATVANGVQFSPDFDSWSQSDKEKYALKTLADTVILGKTCKFHSYSASSTTFAKVADYKGITLYFEVTSTSYNFITYNVCVDFKENVNIPDSKFKVPEGITYN
jgi:hypothetical protein